MANPVSGAGDIRLVVSDGGGPCVVQIIGEVDVATAPTVEHRLSELVESGTKELVLDLSEMDFIDSTGLGIFVVILKRLKDQDGSIVLISPQPATRKVLSITGLDKVLPIAE